MMEPMHSTIHTLVIALVTLRFMMALMFGWIDFRSSFISLHNNSTKLQNPFMALRTDLVRPEVLLQAFLMILVSLRTRHNS